MSEGVPEGWGSSRLAEVSTVITKGTTPTTDGHKYTKSGVKFIRVENISHSGEIVGESFKYIDDNTHGALKRSQLKIGDLLVSIAGAIGRSAIVEKKDLPANTNQAVGIVRLVKEEVNSRYVRYSIESPLVEKQIGDLQAGNAQVNLNLEQLGSLKFLRPPLPEQQKIAKILSSVDEVIEATRAQIDKLKNLKTGMMQEMLSPREGSRQAELMGYSEFKDSPVGRIPVGWDVVAVEDVLKLVIDYRGKSPPKSDTGVPLITAKNIRAGYIDKEPKEYILEEAFESWMVRGVPKSGDVFITTEAPLGNVARVPDYKFAIGQRVLALSPKALITTNYLFYIMQSEHFKVQLDLQSTGSTVAGIKQSTFRKILLPVPLSGSQELICKPLIALDSRIDGLTDKLNQLKIQKKALMQDLLTGKVRVKVDPQ